MMHDVGVESQVGRLAPASNTMAIRLACCQRQRSWQSRISRCKSIAIVPMTILSPNGPLVPIGAISLN
jgi:hypothetical protein